MAPLKIFLFGPPRFERDNQAIDIGRRKVAALLIYLVVNRQPYSRDSLATLLWPDSDQRTARANLRRTLYRLGQTVGEDLLTVSGDTISLNPEAELWLDVEVFQQHVAAGLPADHPAEALEPDCLARLTAAAGLYTGDFLAGFTLSDSPEFDDWQFFQAEGLRQTLSYVLAQLVTAQQNRAEFEPAIAWGRRWLALDPLHEAAHRRLMRLYAQAGQPAAALRQYQECVRLLEEELGLAPEPETTALFEAIKHRGVPPVRPATDQRPQTPAAPAEPRHNLPAQPTPFIGRAAELAALSQLDTRLITIVGAGGMGKTRLALALATEALKQKPATAPFADGIFFIPLASVDSAEQLIPSLAAALSFELEASSSSAASPRRQILAYLERKHCLLIFDNCEHLLDELALVSDILAQAPGVRIVATSRERLNLHQETVFAIQGLAYPEAEIDLPATLHDAAQLFLQSARRARPDFALTPADWPAIARICRLVAGMPLGLELAASWVDVLSLADIASEIQQNQDFLETNVRNIPPRHRSIRAVFDTSWQRLAPAERNTFAQLSIFRGGFTRPAAQEIAGASIRMLARLVDKSLLQYDRARDRYVVHELLRQYGVEKLAIAMHQEEMAVRDRFSAYYCAGLAQLEPALKGPDQQTVLAAIARDEGNFLAAWQWAAGKGYPEQLGQAMNCLGLFLEWRARFNKGESLFRLAVQALDPLVAAHPSDAASSLILVQLLTWQSLFTRLCGHRSQAEKLAQRSLALLDNSGIPESDAVGRMARALLLMQFGHLAINVDNAAAKQWYEQAAALFRSLDAAWELAFVLTALSELYQAAGQYGRATALAEESLEIERKLDHRRGMARSLAHLSLAARHTGQGEAAVRFARESYAAYEALGHRLATAEGLHHLGMSLTYIGEFTEALAALEQSIALYTDLGHRLSLPLVYARAAINAMSLGQYEKARPYVDNAINLGREFNDQSTVALALTFSGWLHLVDEAYAQAQERLTESLAIFHAIGRAAESGMALGLLGGVYRGLGERAQAQDILRQALQDALTQQNFLPLTSSLPLVALMLMEQAEVLSGDVAERCRWRALSLYALGNRYPPIGQAREVDDIAGRYLRPLLAALPPAVVAEATSQGQQLELWPAIARLLAELPDFGWQLTDL